MMARPHRLLTAAVLLQVLVGLAISSPAAYGAASGPIDHVVVLYLENHSFNQVLGRLCVLDSRCVGTRTGTLLDGTPIALHRAHDLVPLMGHGTKATVSAINGGAMNGFETIVHCGVADKYRCYSQYGPRQIPNLSVLARSFVISDMTFNSSPYSSWVSHIALVAGTDDGFVGNIPHPSPGQPPGPGWGCDSLMDATWQPPTGGPSIVVPSCIPDQNGFGPYTPSPVSWVPTIMDRMDEAGLSWKIDGGQGTLDTSAASGYIWTACPSFAECLYSPQVDNLLPASAIMGQANNGNLPALALVIPAPPQTQHNGTSMLTGDNWIGQVVGALMSGPEWSSTTIFITYDDCGCFYDNVPPPDGFGIRSPMVIVSPYARPGFTDSNVASTDSILAFVEHTFGLPPLGAGDAGAYDYSDSFDLTQPPLRPVQMVRTAIPAPERHWLAAHPVHVGQT